MDGFYSEREELFHSATHGAGALIAAAGAGYLLGEAWGAGDGWRLAAFAIYGATLVLLYTASTLYHAARSRGLKETLRVLDHSAIYLLIAGTYTPFLLLRLREPWGWTVLVAMWATALGGVAYKLNFLDRFPRASTAMYLGMAWLGLVAGLPLIHRLGLGTLGWLLAGGLIYTAGTLLYHLERVPYAHVVWHMFVLGGSVCHFVAITHL